jgi:hypothetical protein
MARKAQESEPELGGQNGRQRPIFRCLDPERLHTSLFGTPAHAIEENSLADAPKTYQQATLRRPSCPNPFEGDTNVLPELIAAREFRRRCAGARSEGVPNRIHEPSIAILVEFINIP